MLKLFISFLLFFSFLNANIKNAKASYDISYGIFGVLGKAKATILTNKDNQYIIKVKAYATGFSKTLSGHLVETYISKGKFINGKFTPSYFKKVTSQNDKIKTYEYIFDYHKKQILLNYTKKYKYYIEDDNTDNILNISYDNYEWRTSYRKKTLKYWANEDILSLFFNIKHYIKNINKTTVKHIKTVGAGEKSKGKVDIIVPNSKKREELKELLQTNQNLLIVKIYKDIFSSENGELYISLNKDGIANKSILKDVLFFGDIIGTLK